MAEITLTAEVGRTTGSRASRRLRNGGRIPAVVYGHGMDPLAVSVSARELRSALTGDAGSNALLSLDTGSERILALARELQRHPVKGTVVHVDFQTVRRDEVIAAEVPVTLVGEAIEVHRADGLVDQLLFTVTVRARSADIPTAFELDISALTVGDALRVRDLPLPDGVTIDLEPDVVVISAQAGRLQVSEGGEESAEGASDAGAGGANSGEGSSEE